MKAELMRKRVRNVLSKKYRFSLPIAMTKCHTWDEINPNLSRELITRTDDPGRAKFAINITIGGIESIRDCAIAVAHKYTYICFFLYT